MMKRKGLLAFFNNREFDKWCYVYFDTGLLYRYTKLLIIFGGLVRMAITIRLASLDDAKALLDIYRYYVEETAITFEYDVPTLEEFTGRMRSIMAFYPYLVAEEDGKILGYAYASKFHPRAAYAWSAEVTVYLDKATRGKGVGRQIYGKLEDYLTQMGILNLNACIASTDVEDAYLTNGSEKFHRALGYQLVGKFHDSGYKFNRWYDMIWMEKILGEHGADVAPVKSIHEITKKA